MTLPTKVTEQLKPENARVIEAVKAKSEQLLDHTPRFRFFTLHGKQHLDSLFRILSILLEAGVTLNERELYLISLAICTHDLGMVVSLRDFDFAAIAEGRPGFSDPVGFENFVRDTHHLLIEQYFARDLTFPGWLGDHSPRSVNSRRDW